MEMKLKDGGKSPKKKYIYKFKKIKIKNFAERWTYDKSLSLSLSLSLSTSEYEHTQQTQVNMSPPNIGKHAGQTCSLWNNETKPVIFIQTFAKEITYVIFSPLDKDNLQLL